MAVYESMKDSGIEWIGNIPSTWKAHTLYQLVTQVKNKNSNLSEQNLHFIKLWKNQTQRYQFKWRFIARIFQRVQHH